MGCRVLPALLSLLRARAGAGAVPGVVVAAAVGPGQRVMAQLGALGCSEQEQAEEGAELFLLGQVTSSAQTLRSRQHHSPAHFDRIICTLGTGCSCLSRKCPFWYWQGLDPDSPDTPTWQRPPSFLLSLFSFLPFSVSLAPSTPLRCLTPTSGGAGCALCAALSHPAPRGRGRLLSACQSFRDVSVPTTQLQPISMRLFLTSYLKN